MSIIPNNSQHTPTYKLYLKTKVNKCIITIELTVLTEIMNNVLFVPELFNYDKIIDDDKEELLKLFYYFGCDKDFALYSLDDISNKTKVYLINNSIQYRNYNMIKRFIDEVSYDELNMKVNDYDRNIIEILTSHGSSRSYNQKINYPNEDLELLNIIEYILERKPKLITEHAYITARALNNNKIIELFNKYNTSTDESKCYICYSPTEPDRLITDICLCKTEIHYHCAMELIKTNGDICKTCNSNFKKNTPINLIGIVSQVLDTSVYFPHLGLFPIPLLCNKFSFSTTLFTKIKYSIIYLQSVNLISILTNLTPTERKELKTQLIEF